MPHLDAAYNLARWILRDDADARDVAQESAMRAWRYFGTLRGSDPLPWFLRIVRNTAYTFIQRRRQEEAMPEDLVVEDAGAVDPAAKMIEEVDAEALRRAVENLPAGFREVIILREMEGMSYKEIAGAMDISVGTVMSRIARARKRLQLALVGKETQETDHGM